MCSPPTYFAAALSKLPIACGVDGLLSPGEKTLSSALVLWIIKLAARPSSCLRMSSLTVLFLFGRGFCFFGNTFFGIAFSPACLILTSCRFLRRSYAIRSCHGTHEANCVATFSSKSCANLRFLTSRLEMDFVSSSTCNKIFCTSMHWSLQTIALLLFVIEKESVIDLDIALFLSFLGIFDMLNTRQRFKMRGKLENLPKIFTVYS